MRRSYLSSALAFASAVCSPSAMLLLLVGGVGRTFIFRRLRPKPVAGFAGNASDPVRERLSVKRNQERAAIPKAPTANTIWPWQNSAHADRGQLLWRGDAQFQSTGPHTFAARLSFSVAALSLATVRFGERTESTTHLPQAVLLIGGPSSNKLSLARQFQCAGVRRDKPFAHFSCDALLTESQLDGLMFGWVRIKSTDSPTAPASLRSIRGGTLYLEDIDRLADKFQHDLFAALDTQELVPPATSESVAIDVRVLASVDAFLMDRDADECVCVRVPICMLALYLTELRVLGGGDASQASGPPKTRRF